MYLRFRLELLINLSMISLLRNLLLLFLLFTSCQTPTSNLIDKIIQQSNAVYGFDKPDYKIEFDFRDYHYSLERNQGFYSYSRQITKEGKKIVDLMTSVDILKRFENDSLVFLQDSIRKLYSNSLNSVMYFFQLPSPPVTRYQALELIRTHLHESITNRILCIPGYRLQAFL